jgi:hypothetical protein
MRNFVLILAGLCLFAAAAHAEQMPDNLLQKDYDNCMGGEKDPQREQYCECVRNGMRSWTVDEYGNVATEAKNSSATPAAVEALAKSCLAQIFH